MLLLFINTDINTMENRRQNVRNDERQDKIRREKNVRERAITNDASERTRMLTSL